MSTGIFGLLPPSHQERNRLHDWQGRSGRWWITTVYPLATTHIDLPSVYLMVRRDSSGMAHPLYIGQAENTARRMDEHAWEKMFKALLMGGNELHLHFLAKTKDARLQVETDLRNAHAAPLNEQPSEALGLGGLFRFAQRPPATGLRLGL